MTSEPKFSNALMREKSPYLLQHAHNPVDWLPWGEQAFSKALEEDKPIFLSIGYSTCHWCHVMERESFENPVIAKVLNDSFVAIKVDREERPDIDNIYMSAVTAMTGQGGWPLSVFLTPEQKPFFGGTYFPPAERWGQPGFVDVLRSVSHAWKTQREDVLRSSQDLIGMMQRNLMRGQSSGKLTEDLLKQAYQELAQNYDEKFGGFGSSPKFPMGHNLSFLLRYYKRYEQQDILGLVEHTLTAMARGGIYDQLGGGFHRYSTDAFWHVPHFEKMLYDQALLARVYLEAYQITKKQLYARVAREIFDFVLRELTDSEGGFYSALDADSLSGDGSSGKKEGAFYVWSHAELEEVLDSQLSDIIRAYYGIGKDGNVRSDPHGEFTGQNILFVDQDLNALATKFQLSPQDIAWKLDEAKTRLLSARNQRHYPHLDDKVLVDWNGLMIGSLSFGARVLNEPKYGHAAQRGADFILQKMTKNRRLLHRYREGEAAIHGTIEDYAFFIAGLLELYEFNFEPSYLKAAKELSEEMIKLFWDDQQGGFFFSGQDAEEMIVRQKEIYDGAIPSGNSFAALVLLKLYHFTLDASWKDKAEKVLRVFAGDICLHAGAYCQMLIGYDFFLGPVREIVIAGQSVKDAEPFFEKISATFLPNSITMFRSEENVCELKKTAPCVEHQDMKDGLTTAYICSNHICQKPIVRVDQFAEQIQTKDGL